MRWPAVRDYRSKTFIKGIFHVIVKGVFTKNERGYRLTAKNYRWWSLLILLLSVASIRRNWKKRLFPSDAEKSLNLKVFSILFTVFFHVFFQAELQEDPGPNLIPLDPPDPASSPPLDLPGRKQRLIYILQIQPLVLH